MRNILFIVMVMSILSHVQAQKIPNQPLELNSKAPSFEGIDQNGDTISLSDLLSVNDNVVLVFYRGSWCPYCQKHLSQIQDSLQLILDKNTSVIVVSPEQPEFVEKMIGKTNATYAVLHDEGYKIMKAFNVDYVINNETVTKFYGAVKSRTAKANGNNEGILPIPATYIINKDGMIKWIHFDSDYKKRSSIAEILKQL